MNEDLLRVLERSRERGLLGPGPIDDHIRNANAFVAELGGARRVVDLGSGGGVPGLVVAVARPDVELLLVEAARRRANFLLEAIADLRLRPRVRVGHGRAEDLARRPDLRAAFDAVLARAFGAPAVTAECAVGFLAGPGSVVLVSEPPGCSDGRWPVSGLARVGLAVGELRGHRGTTIRRLEVEVACDPRYPRRAGMPAKRPLFD